MPTAAKPVIELPIERPDFSVHVARPGAPKDKKDIPFTSDTSEHNGSLWNATGNVLFELPDSTLKADSVVYDDDTGIATATGHVYYRDYNHDEVIYADTGTYDTNTEKGEFHHVRGYMKAKVVARPGVLTSKDPFYFEADRVEKLPQEYILHDAFITDCEMPNPWWTLHSALIEFYPHDHALAHDAVNLAQGFPDFPCPPQLKAAACAAIPLANATAPHPPSRLATRSSKTATVGFMIREYVFPYSCRLK